MCNKYTYVYTLVRLLYSGYDYIHQRKFQLSSQGFNQEKNSSCAIA